MTDFWDFSISIALFLSMNFLQKCLFWWLKNNARVAINFY